MDGFSFDRLTKILTEPRSRRRALGGILAGGFGLLGAGAEDADAHNLKATCKKKSGAAKKKCLKKAKKHAATHDMQVSPPPPVCNPPCQGDLTCSNGTCTCASGTRCGVNCGFNLQTDVRNCGECGKACSFPHATARCVSGTCQIDTCDPGFLNCSPSTEDGCETELGTPEHCSTCGDVCDAPRNGTTTCKPGPGPGPGECVDTCDPGFEECTVDGRTACCSTKPIDFCRLQHPASMTRETSETTQFIYGRIYEAGVTEGAGASETITAQVGYGPAGSDPRTASTWRYQPATFSSDQGNDDEYQGTFTAPATAGTYAYVYRFSLDAGNTWTYCDLDGSGRNANTDFDASNLGVMTVQ